MKKINKKFIVILIILIILMIVGLKAFNNSKANKTIEIKTNFKDIQGLVDEETMTLLATNDGENGIAITLPEIVNEKKVSKYIMTKKDISNDNIDDDADNSKVESVETKTTKSNNTDITKTESTETKMTSETSTKLESTITEKTTTTANTKTESTETKATSETSLKTENTITKATNTVNTKTENTKTENIETKSTNSTVQNTTNPQTEAITDNSSSAQSTKNETMSTNDTKTDKILSEEEKITEQTKTESTILEEKVEKNPGEKIYLTEEEIKSSELILEVNYDTLEENSQILYNKKISYNDDESELITVSGYMLLDTKLKVVEADISSLEQELEQKYNDYNFVRKL